MAPSSLVKTSLTNENEILKKFILTLGRPRLWIILGRPSWSGLLMKEVSHPSSPMNQIKYLYLFN